MRILILGINHQIQSTQMWTRGASTSGVLEQFERQQKDQFRELLRNIVSERRVQFVGEETKHGQESIAQKLCASEGRDYANIEIPLEERAARNIPANYENNPKIAPKQRELFNQQREEYMFEKTLQEAPDAESIIVICGRFHTPALADRFREASHDVEEADIQSEPWYVEDWMEHMKRL